MFSALDSGRSRVRGEREKGRERYRYVARRGFTGRLRQTAALSVGGEDIHVGLAGVVVCGPGGFDSGDHWMLTVKSVDLRCSIWFWSRERHLTGKRLVRGRPSERQDIRVTNCVTCIQLSVVDG